MANFKYRALDPQGNEIRNKIEAGNASEATAMLRSRSLHVLEISTAASFSPLGILRFLGNLLSFKRYKKHNTADLVIFFQQMSLMLRSGNTLIQGLQLCSEMTEKISLRKTLHNVLTSIQGGSSFAAAMEKQANQFPPVVAKLIASGEVSGELQVTLDRLADSLERSANIKRQFISAMIYPTILMIVGITVTLFLTLSIIPKMARMLEGRSQDLPPLTQFLVDISAWLTTNGLYLGAVIGISIFLILAAYTTRQGKTVIDRILLYVPFVGTSIRISGMAQMGWTMSLLLSSGLTVLESLRVMGAITDNIRLASCFDQAGQQILAGRSLAFGFKQDHIPPMVQHMSGIGERSGELEFVMRELGSYYEKLAEARIKRMMAAIEPAMTLLIGGLVGTVYYAFFSTMLKLSAA